jgi:hypothetical protein
VRLACFLLAALAFFASEALAKEKATRATAHAAIAYHPESGSVGWATDRKTSREAKIEALRQCSHARCEVVGEASRGCIALARTAKKHVLQQGITREEAEAKALRRCGERCEIAAWTCTR